MAKSPDAFRTISEVAEWMDTPAHVLRFWESRFTQVRPVKRAGGRRYYRPADMALLGGIKKLLHEDGMTIRGVQKILHREGVRHVASLSPWQVAPDAAASEAADAAGKEPRGAAASTRQAESSSAGPLRPAQEAPKAAAGGAHGAGEAAGLRDVGMPETVAVRPHAGQRLRAARLDGRITGERAAFARLAERVARLRRVWAAAGEETMQAASG